MKKKKYKIKRKKYATGTSIKNYIEDPSAVLYQNQINIAKAKHESETNPFINTLKGAGNMALQYGLKMGGFGESAGGQMANQLAPALANAKFMLGTTVGDPPSGDFPETDGINPAIFSQADNFLQNHFLNPETNNRLKSNLESMGKDPNTSEKLLASFIDNSQATKNKTAPKGSGPTKQATGMFQGDTVTLFGASPDNLSTAIHEKTHASGADKLLTDYINQNFGSPFSNKVGMIAKEKGFTKLDNGNYSDGNQTLSPKDLLISTYNGSFNAAAGLNQLRYLKDSEVYPRIQEARQLLNLQPGEEFTDDHLEQIKSHKNLKGLYENYEGETLKNIFNTVASNNDDMGNTRNIAAFGGTMKNVPVEIEGKEVGELPGGELFEAFGPTHENGGIDVNLPAGTEMYSDRIKVDGVTMAGRKKNRKNREMKLEDLLKMDSSDGLLKNTSKRVKKNNEAENARDEKIQDFVKKTVEAREGKHMTGNTVLPPSLAGTGFNPNPNAFNTQLPPEFLSLAGLSDTNIEPNSNLSFNSGIYSDPNKSVAGNKMSQFIDNVGGVIGQEGSNKGHAGDIISMLGSLYSPFKQKNLTLQNRAGDTVNENHFADAGEAALLTNSQAQNKVNSIRDNKKQDLALAANSAKRRNRNSARGINTMRALDLATDQQVNQQNRAIHNDHSNAILNLLAQRSGLENSRDNIQARGAQQADIANRQDRDNFFTQLAQNESDLGAAFQNIGKGLNHIEQQKLQKNLLDQLSKYGITFDKNFNLKSGK